MDGDDDGYRTIPPGVIPADWPDRRHVGTAQHGGDFADIGHSDSIAHLRTALAARLVHYGLSDLDGGDLRRRAPRDLTRAISRYVFSNATGSDGRAVAGIRYLSRLGDELANWAMFEPNEPDGQVTEPLSRHDEDLHAP